MSEEIENQLRALIDSASASADPNTQVLGAVLYAALGAYLTGATPELMGVLVPWVHSQRDFLRERHAAEARGS